MSELVIRDLHIQIEDKEIVKGLLVCNLLGGLH